MTRETIEKVTVTIVLYIAFVLNILSFFSNVPGVIKVLHGSNPTYTYKETSIIYFHPNDIHILDIDKIDFEKEKYLPGEYSLVPDISYDLFSVWNAQTFNLSYQDTELNRELTIEGYTDVARRKSYVTYTFDNQIDFENEIEVGIALHYPIRAFDVQAAGSNVSFRFNNCLTEVLSDGQYYRSEGLLTFFLLNSNQITFEITTECQ